MVRREKIDEKFVCIGFFSMAHISIFQEYKKYNYQMKANFSHDGHAKWDLFFVISY